MILSKKQHNIYYIKDGIPQRNSIIEKDIVMHLYQSKSRDGQKWKENRKAGMVDVK